MFHFVAHQFETQTFDRILKQKIRKKVKLKNRLHFVHKRRMEGTGVEQLLSLERGLRFSCQTLSTFNYYTTFNILKQNISARNFIIKRF